MDRAPETLELPPAPRSLWDFINILAPVLQYYLILLVLFLGARWFNQQINNEATAQARQMARPKLSPELTVVSSEEEEEEIHELVTDGDRLVPMESKDVKKKKKKNAAKELFEGLKKVEQELQDKKANDKAEDNVSWNELHASMLRRYQEKFPGQGPRVADPETDKYDEEFNELLRKNNIDPSELKSENAKKID
ncbi:hypothetical protein PsorP6_010657 [Peronosclerospora sorghi]|uniref:Uncharacterized protein n=1 Tax=Peronosclerospora sorghi TaxID=230839 RepID=A0ACC0VVF2_9STRA|nr:hypothetical protein PsorP6_010657 [Peronosclerospora sorghi]